MKKLLIFGMLFALFSCDESLGLESVEERLGKPSYPLQGLAPDYEQYYDVKDLDDEEHWSWQYVYYNYKNHKITFTYYIDYVNEKWIIKREDEELYFSPMGNMINEEL